MFRFSKIELQKIKDKIKMLTRKFKASCECEKKQQIEDYTEKRKIVSELVFAALTDKFLVREVLLKFPPDCDDETIQATWHALCHRESDEDLRRRDPGYATEQDEFLEMIAFTLQKGEELPRNIIDGYKKYHEEAVIPHSKSVKGIIQKLARFLNI